MLVIGQRRLRHAHVVFTLSVTLLVATSPAAGARLHASQPITTAVANAFSPSAPGVPGVTNSSVPGPTDPALAGSFSPPFAEPGPVCPNESEGSDPSAQTRSDIICKPAAVNIVMLPNGKVVYWDGVEASERLQYTVALEAGSKAVNDQSRQLTINYSDPFKSVWTRPTPVDGGANDRKNYQYLVQNAPGPTKQELNDPGSASGALFCSDQEILSNGDVIVPGGTGYLSEPRLPNSQYGLAEFEGLHSTRIYHPATNTWTQAGDMHWGRWYPSLVTLADGRVLVASGVTKLWKPVYPQHPLDSGSNVKETETFDPKTAKWTPNPPSASYSLPLYPRLHLLPDGNVYYDAGGGTFSYFGQSYDEALWNLAAVYSPKTQSWRQIGVPWTVSIDTGRPLDTSVAAGFRNQGFSIMLPLEPDAHGNYTKASFLSGGGVLGTATGTYLATTSSGISTVDTSNDDAFSSQPTGPLNNARWFSTAVLLPTGQVMAFNGANRDEVAEPGTGFAVREAEMFDPRTRRWTRMAVAHDERTYHNTAVLLPTGQVLVGGHAPMPFLYGKDQTGPAGLSNDFRDPSFELYDPPYLHWGIAQPALKASSTRLRYGQSLTIATPHARSIASVVLIRNPSVTHLIDGDQRSVVLPITRRGDADLTVAVPRTRAVAPPGPYLLFINERTRRGLIPSRAQQVWVASPGDRG